MNRADLSGADLSGSILHFPFLQGANLSGANLSKAVLSEPYLSGTNLSRTNLSEAILSHANLSGVDLSETNLNRARLHGANLSGVNLSGVDLRGVDLGETNLNGARLNDANLSGAIFGWTVLDNIDFRTTKGLATIEHLGPSPVSLASVQLPQDGGALPFLRGIGLTDEQIRLWRNMTMLPIQYHSVFISFSNKDEALARRLHTDLQDHGVRCWFALENMKIGDKIRDRIDQAISLQDRSLLLLSESSIASTWVENEVEAVLEK